jgi:hypothetical protein
VPGFNEPLVQLPGTNQFIPLSKALNLPPGTKVNVSGGAAIALKDENGKTMIFYGLNDGVPSVFVIGQPLNGFVQLTLTGGNFSSFKRHVSASVATPPKKPVRRLFGSGQGKFTTKGRFAAATVRGTKYLVADFKDGTRVAVERGVVSVRDLVKKKTVLVRAGKSYFAAKKPRKK